MRRTGQTDGVSWTSAVMGLGAVLVWLAYGLVKGDTVQIVNNTVGLLAATALCALLVRFARPKLWPALAALAGGVAALAAVWLGAGVAGVAVAASALSMLRMLPQAKVVLSSGSLFGLCPWSTVLSQAGSVLWLGYGLIVSDPAVTVTSLVAAALSTLVAARRLPPRRTLHSLAQGRLGPLVAAAVAPATRLI